MQTINLKEDFEICDLQARTDNSDKMSGCGKTVNLWKEFLGLGYDNLDKIYAVYYEYESDENSSFVIDVKDLKRKINEKILVKMANTLCLARMTQERVPQ